jgi:ceramide glucosyltransferase
VALGGLGIIRDVVQTRWLRGTFPKLRHWPLSLVKDLFLLPVWFDALYSRRVQWRGNRFLVGRLTRLRRARVPRSVRRRMRRVRRLRARLNVQSASRRRHQHTPPGSRQKEVS